MTASAYVQPLELDKIFINMFAGSPAIFMAIFIIVFSILAGYFRMGGLTYVMLLALASMMLPVFFGSSGLFIFIIFIGGLLIFWVISKIVKE